MRRILVAMGFATALLATSIGSVSAADSGAQGLLAGQSVVHIAGQVMISGIAVSAKLDANGRPVLQPYGPGPLAPIHSRGNCGTVDMYFARDGHFHLVVNLILAVDVGNWSVYSDGYLSSTASGFYSTVTGYFATVGDIWPGWGASGMGTDGWAVLSSLQYCTWGGPANFGNWY
jgi:hypothetical protein